MNPDLDSSSRLTMYGLNPSVVSWNRSLTAFASLFTKPSVVDRLPSKCCAKIVYYIAWTMYNMTI